MTRKIVIVGAVGGGSTVASQIRRLDPEATIILFEQGDEIAFSNCGMPYYIGNVIEDREAILTDADTFQRKKQVDVRLQAEVTTIDRKAKTITYSQASATHDESYDTLILSPGATAVIPPLEGINSESIFTLRTIPDMDQVKTFIEDHQPKTCTIVGGGFIGLEMVENLVEIGLTCTIIDHSSHLLNILDADMAKQVQDHVEEKGVKLRLGQAVDRFTNQGKTTITEANESLDNDMVILSVGIRPNVKLAQDAGLAIGETGAIKVNDYMQTTDPDIYALGDAVETKDLLAQKPRNIALASPAHRQAYIIAKHLTQAPIPYQGVLGTSIFRVFDLTVGSTGQTSTTLKNDNQSFKTVTHQALSHAGYFPGAEKLTIKLFITPNNGQILGGQVIGQEGADKRLAVLATAIRGKLTVHELAELELAYAPPYSSPKDAINTIAYKAISQLEDA